MGSVGYCGQSKRDLRFQSIQFLICDTEAVNLL